VKKLKDMLVTGQYHAKISKTVAFSRNLDNNADINSAWENVVENNNISAKEGSNYCEQTTVSQRVHKTVTLGTKPSCNSYTVQVK
jgi:hypothetical protein